jgi:ligand-binding SRPBCC domain-containing protein
MDFYDYFVDEMQEGKFKTFRHEHFFEEKNGVTIMTDQLQYETPFSIIGKLFDALFLKKHLIGFLIVRNKMLKKTAENQ